MQRLCPVLGGGGFLMLKETRVGFADCVIFHE